MLYAPLYKVELRHSRLNLGSRVWNLVLKLFGPAKRVEELLAVSVEARLVRAVDGKRLAVGGLVREILLLRVVGYEPLEFPSRNSTGLLKNDD